MNKRISILGCGWLGLALAKQLINNEFEVKGSTTSINKVQILSSHKLKPYLINLEDINTDLGEFLNSDILIIAVTLKNIKAFKELIDHISRSEIKNVIFVSSTSVYENSNLLITEETQVKDCVLSNIENLFTSNLNFQSTIIRFGGLFGYDRKPGNFFKGNKVINQPDGYINLIHRDDCIGIIEKIIELKVWGEIFNACTDTHPTRREFYTKEVKKLFRDTPKFNENSTTSYKIVSSEKLKSSLDYRFKYPDLMNLSY